MEKEKQDDYEVMAEAMEKEKVTVTTRLDSMQAAYLDMLAKKCDLSRSAMLNELATSALMDVMEKMGVTEEFFNNLAKNVKKETVNV
jgi:hypothetical protein